MNTIFRPYLRKFILVFFDDILIYSSSWESHLEHIRITFSVLRDNQLFVKRSKSSFGMQQIEFFGHVISVEGVSADPSKIHAMVSWPRHSNHKELRSFFGLTNYYRRFIQHYGNICRTLHDILKNEKFSWNSEVEGAFTNLKSALTSAPLLALPNFA